MEPERGVLTWGEFKRLVEECGAVDETPIEYIELSHPTRGPRHAPAISLGCDKLQVSN